MIPNEDRTGYKFAVDFSSIMLAGTEFGDTYTETQVKSMLKNTGFDEKVESYVVSFAFFIISLSAIKFTQIPMLLSFPSTQK